MYGLCEFINPSNASTFPKSKISVNFLLPKYFNIILVLENSSRVISEAPVYNSPTYFSPKISPKKEEFTYADIAECNEKKNDRMYILRKFFVAMFLLYT